MLRLGFKYALPAAGEAYELEFLQGRLVAKAQVSYASWMWRARVRRPEFFHELKALLHLPDGRLPKKRKLTPADVEARLLAGGELQRAVELLHAFWPQLLVIGVRPVHWRPWFHSMPARAAAIHASRSALRIFRGGALPYSAALLQPQTLARLSLSLASENT